MPRITNSPRFPDDGRLRVPLAPQRHGWVWGVNLVFHTFVTDRSLCAVGQDQSLNVHRLNYLRAHVSITYRVHSHDWSLCIVVTGILLRHLVFRGSVNDPVRCSLRGGRNFLDETWGMKKRFFPIWIVCYEIVLYLASDVYLPALGKRWTNPFYKELYSAIFELPNFWAIILKVC